MKSVFSKRICLLALTLCAAVSVCCLSACTSRKDSKKGPQTVTAPASAPVGSAQAPDEISPSPSDVSSPAPAPGDDREVLPSASAQDTPDNAAPGSPSPPADQGSGPVDSSAEDTPEAPSGQETDKYSFHIEENGDIVLPEV